VLPFIEQKGMIMGGHRLVEFVTAAGFIDIQVLEYKIPCGTWAAGTPFPPVPLLALTVFLSASVTSDIC